MWYIIDEPDSYLYYGFSKEISREEFAHRIADDTLLEVVQKVPVKKEMFSLSLPALFMQLVRHSVGRSAAKLQRYLPDLRLWPPGH